MKQELQDPQGIREANREDRRSRIERMLALFRLEAINAKNRRYTLIWIATFLQKTLLGSTIEKYKVRGILRTTNVKNVERLSGVPFLGVTT